MAWHFLIFESERWGSNIEPRAAPLNLIARMFALHIYIIYMGPGGNDLGGRARAARALRYVHVPGYGATLDIEGEAL